MKLKTIAAVVALAASGAASAAPIGLEGLFFSAIDQTNNTSIVITLNETTTQFRASPNANRTLGGDGLGDLNAWLATADLTAVSWNVAGASDDGTQFNIPPSPLFGGLSTGTDIETVFPGWGSFGGLDSTVGNFTIFRNLMNPNLNASDGFQTQGNSAFFFVNQNGGVGFQSVGGVGALLPFYSFFADQDGNSFFEGDYTKFAGSWQLTYDVGTGASLTYAATAPVPVPAAVWLLGSALLGMVGVSRRKQS